MKRILSTFSVLGVVGLFAGCIESGPVVSDPAAIQSLVAQECAIYVAAEQQLAAEGRGVNGALSTGCPTGTVAGNITATGAAGQATGFSEILFRRMIARGMPNDLAVQVSTSPAFKNLVAFQASNAL